MVILKTKVSRLAMGQCGEEHSSLERIGERLQEDMDLGCLKNSEKPMEETP